MAPARGGDRTPDTGRRSVRRRGVRRRGVRRQGRPTPRRSTGLGGTAMACAALLGSLGTSAAAVAAVPRRAAPAAHAPTPDPGPVAPVVAAASGRATDSLTLVRQSAWVGPHAPDQDLTLDLRIASGAARSSLELSITVYDHLTSRSAFDETMSGRSLGLVASRSPALSVSSLTTDAQGVTHLTIPVVGDTTPSDTGDWTADLGCQPGSCADVYPVKIALDDPSSPRSADGASGAQLITYLVYDDPSPASQPLRVALVAPLGLAPPTAGADGRVAPPPSAAVARLQGLVDAVAGAGEVPLTLAPDPATLGRLGGAARARMTTAVAALAASPARQTLSQSYVPVDATALADAGLAGELRAQTRRAAQTLAATGTGVHASTGTWVAAAPLDQAALDLLAPVDGHMVVPQAGVTGPTGPLTTSQPFTLTSGHGASVTAAVSDPGLGAHLAAGAGSDPALAAAQLMADLSLIYYEAPNLRGTGGTPAPRGVVAVAPPEWAPQAAFVSAVLGGLQGNPVIQPVTLDQLFQQVPVGVDHQPSTRRPVAAAPAALPVGALRGARGRQQGFASAVAGSAAGAAAAQGLDDLLLAAEASTLTPRQQQRAVAGFESALDASLQLLSVRSDTIRLTAGAASVPITVVRNAPYPVTVVVRLTSDKLQFPGASAQSPGGQCRAPEVRSSAGRSSFSSVCVLDHATNAVYVSMQSRTAGDFRVDVTLSSPQGVLVLANGQLTVRSMSTSAVAIALSAGAALVLAAWWGRTLWRGRWRRRGAHSRDAAGGAGDPESGADTTAPEGAP